MLVSQHNKKKPLILCLSCNITRKSPLFYAFQHTMKKPLILCVTGNIVLHCFLVLISLNTFLGLKLLPAIKNSIYILAKVVHLISHSYRKLYVFNAANLVN